MEIYTPTREAAVKKAKLKVAVWNSNLVCVGIYTYTYIYIYIIYIHIYKNGRGPKIKRFLIHCRRGIGLESAASSGGCGAQ